LGCRSLYDLGYCGWLGRVGSVQGGGARTWWERVFEPVDASTVSEEDVTSADVVCVRVGGCGVP
jgi:hypothetical protein